MPETPRMSKLHAAVSYLNATLEHHGDEHDSAKLQVIEDHSRDLLLLLKSIVAHSDLTGIPADVLKQLGDLGVIKYDDSHVAHAHALTSILSDLEQPQKAPIFFNKYHSLFPTLARHDKLATLLIKVLLLWRQGLVPKKVLHEAIDEYSELAPHFMIKEKS